MNQGVRRYLVTIRVVSTYSIEVEAEDEETAIAMAAEKIGEEEPDTSEWLDDPEVVELRPGIEVDGHGD